MCNNNDMGKQVLDTWRKNYAERQAPGEIY